jgi:hypothetical protein
VLYNRTAAAVLYNRTAAAVLYNRTAKAAGPRQQVYGSTRAAGSQQQKYNSTTSAGLLQPYYKQQHYRSNTTALGSKQRAHGSRLTAAGLHQ